MKLITAKELRDRQFNTTRFREGYDEDDVDDALERAIETLEWYEHWIPLPLLEESVSND